MNNGGKHNVRVPNPSPPDGGVFRPKGFDPGSPDLQEEWNAEMFPSPENNPLAGKSGKDSLSEEEAQLS